MSIERQTKADTLEIKEQALFVFGLGLCCLLTNRSAIVSSYLLE
jgi:hypothetical protein